MSLSAFTPRALTTTVRQWGDSLSNYLMTTLFARRELHATQIIDIGVLNGNATLAPYTGAGQPAVAVSFLTGQLKTFTPPIINMKKTLDENKAGTINPGIPVYGGMYTDPNAQIAEKIALELQDMRKKLDRSIEVQCAAMLSTGQVVLTLDDGTVVTLTVGYTGDGSTAGDTLTIQPTLSGTNAWSSATSRPFDDLRSWGRQLENNTDLGGELEVLLGWAAADAFYNNPQVQDVLDNRRITLGEISIQDRKLIAEAAGFSIREYQMGYADQAGARQVSWAPNKMVMAPRDPAMYSVEFGGIYDFPTPEIKLPEFMRTDYFAKMVIHRDPPVVDMILQSRPMAMVSKPSAVRVCQVVAAP